MDAQVSQEGSIQGDQGTTTQAPEAPQQQAPQVQVPPELMQRFDEVAGFQQEMRPLLEQWQQQQAPQEDEAGYEDFVDPAYGVDQDALQGYIQQEAARIAQEQANPLQAQLQQINERFTQEEFADLQDQYPQLADPTFQQTFIPQVEQAAQHLAQSLGMGAEYAQKLALSPRFVADQYLAGMARQQAQQGVPAGDRGVPLEGGTGHPGQPERDAKQEWFGGMQLGAQSGPWGKPASEL